MEQKIGLPGWVTWPETVWASSESAVKTRGRLAPPGLFVFEGLVYIVLVYWVLWTAVGSPAEISAHWIAAGLAIYYDPYLGWFEPGNLPGWIAVGIIAASVPVYGRLWRPLMIRLLGEKFEVLVTMDQVSVRRGWGRKLVVPLALEPSFLVEPHRRAKAAARMQPGRDGLDGYYRDSLEVVMRVGEVRHVIAAVRPEDEALAEALVLRLQAVASGFNTIVAAVGGGAEKRAREGRLVKEGQKVEGPYL